MNAKLNWLSLSLMLSVSMAASAASPAGSSDVPQQTISYADLDVTHPAGAAALYTRIKVAAESVCGPEQRSLSNEVRHMSCVHLAIRSAVAAVGAPQLSRIYMLRTGETIAPQLSVAKQSQ